MIDRPREWFSLSSRFNVKYLIESRDPEYFEQVRMEVPNGQSPTDLSHILSKLDQPAQNSA
jgi:hypothetical protein